MLSGPSLREGLGKPVGMAPPESIMIESDSIGTAGATEAGATLENNFLPRKP